MNSFKRIVLFFCLAWPLCAFSQPQWQTKFVLEFWRDDTSNVIVFDTIIIGLDMKADVGFQDSLDLFIDSSENVHAFLIDTIFYENYSNKKLVRDIRKYPNKIGITEFWTYINKPPNSIYYDTNTIQLYIPPFQTSIEGSGPKGSSIGNWDSNSFPFLFFNRIPKREIPRVDFLEIPYSFFFRFRIYIFDSLSSVLEQTENPQISIDVNEREILISSKTQIGNAKIELLDLSGKMIKSNILNIENQTTISTEELNTGIYFLLIDNNYKTIYKKIFKP